jgi:hypothetical protein
MSAREKHDRDKLMKKLICFHFSDFLNLPFLSEPGSLQLRTEPEFQSDDLIGLDGRMYAFKPKTPNQNATYMQLFF